MKSELKGLCTAIGVSAALVGTVGAGAQSAPTAGSAINVGDPIQVASAAALGSIDLASLGSKSLLNVPEAPKIFGLTLFGEERLRVEDYNWWSTPKAKGDYAFVDSRFRLGLKESTKNNDILIELENPTMFNLPTKAVGASPQGSLGSGANYFSANNSQTNPSNVFLKQGYVKFKTPGPDVSSFKAGRFEYSDGAELQTKDPTLKWLTNNRIKERLIGPSPFTNVGRSFDGFEVAQTSPTRAVSAAAMFPTRGIYDVNGMDTLTGVKIATISSTVEMPGKSSDGLGRLFAIYYEDDRNITKVDDRPTAVKSADHDHIRLENIGGNYERVFDVGPGKLDMLGWAVGQFGSWGEQEQAAYAYDAELGYQFTHASWKPWLRGGMSYYSGDGNPNNGTHSTFVPMIYTSRLYFRDLIATESNLQDLFLSAIFRSSVNPHAPVGTPSQFTIRTELHAYSLANSHDLWYTGSGAYNDSSFGFTGRNGGGAGSLATTGDISFDYQPSKTTLFTLYFSYANGGDVVADIYKNRDMVFSYAEATYKF